jgi:hypothetical protein
VEVGNLATYPSAAFILQSLPPRKGVDLKKYLDTPVNGKQNDFNLYVNISIFAALPPSVRFWRIRGEVVHPEDSGG